jgi:hypothetical protein
MNFFPKKIDDMMSPELKLAVACVRPEHSGGGHAAAAGLIDSGLDWNLFIQWVLRHRIYPQVYPFLRGLQHPGVPTAVLDTLNRDVRANNFAALKRVGELVRIVGLLERNGIRAVVLKGYPLAQMLYGNFTARPSVDIDIVVQPESLSSAREIITNQGYVWFRAGDAVATDEAAWMEAHHNFDYFNEELQIALELHWRLASHGIDIPTDLVESSLERMAFAGHTFTVLGREVLLLYLISHGAGHAWSCLQWLRDIDAMVKRGLFSWNVLYELADSLASRHFVNQAMILARSLLGTPLPDDIASALEEDKRAEDLAIQAIGIMTTLGYQQNNLHLFSRMFYQDRKYRLALLNGGVKKMAYVMMQADYYSKEAVKGLGRRLGIIKRQ